MKVFMFMMLLTKTILFSNGLIITNGPKDTTVCMNAMAECNCGFTESDPSFAVPDWRIVFRSDNGSVIGNDTINGVDIINRLINGLQWLPDITSGDNNAPNSKLLVGPVNMTHNQSSYQCIFTRGQGGAVISSVGTMTVVDPPSAVIEICTTSIIISLNTHSHPACGDVSHDVTISDNVVYPDTVGGSNYIIDELQSDTLYNITVTSTYNSGSRRVSQSVRTSLAKPPYPIDVASIEAEKTNDDNVRIMWKPPEIDKCSMLAIKHYDVIIYSEEGEIIASEDADNNSVTLPMKDLNDYSNTAFTINVTVTVVDIEGQRSTPSTHAVIINGTQNTNPINVGESEEPNNEGSDGDSDDSNAIVIPIAIVLVLTGLVIIIIVIILLYLRHRHLHKSHDVKSGKRTKDNWCTQDESISQDTALYAVSGPTPVWSDSTHSNNNEVKTTNEPSIHNDHVDEPLHNDNIDEDEFTPPLPPKLNYAEILLASEVPKVMKAENHVAYAETKPA